MMTVDQRNQHLAILQEFILMPEPTLPQRQAAAASLFLMIGQALLDLSRIADNLEIQSRHVEKLPTSKHDWELPKDARS